VLREFHGLKMSEKSILATAVPILVNRIAGFEDHRFPKDRWASEGKIMVNAKKYS
jgi:hypothetical protein